MKKDLTRGAWEIRKTRWNKWKAEQVAAKAEEIQLEQGRERDRA